MKTKCKKREKVRLPKGTLEESIARISRAIAEAKEEKKMYSIRLKVKTVESIKRKAAAAGIPYQTYVNVLLDNAASA